MIGATGSVGRGDALNSEGLAVETFVSGEN
jgi:hypothetical protein